MKTPKLNVSKQGFKDFFFRHSEKLFFALSVGLIALFFWLGFKTPRYEDTTPSEMIKTSERADTYIHDTSAWNKIAEHRVPITDAAQKIESTQPFDADQLTFRHMMGTVVRTLEKRTDPAFLTPGDLETRYIRAQVAVAPKAGVNNPTRATVDKLPNSTLTLPANQLAESFMYRVKNKNASFVTVDAVVGMALIDYEAQIEAYRETFQYQRGYDPIRDVPRYGFVEVQRKTADSDWQPITARLFEHISLMGTAAKDVVTDDLIEENVTMPVPPFLGMDYREFATLPEMKAVTIENYIKKKEAENKPDISDDQDDEKSDDSDWFGGGNSAKSGDPAADTGQAKDEPADEEKEEVVKYRLVRFFDLETKKPGEEYFYRVRLWFVDPNNPTNTGKAATKEKTGPSLATGGPQGGGGVGGARDGAGGGKGGKKKRELKPLLLDDLSPGVRDRLMQAPPEIAGVPEEFNKEEFLRSIVPGEWVESTQPVSATRGFETFVTGPVDAPSPNPVGNVVFYESEPEATIVANSFQNDLGVFVPAKTSVLPGSVLNFRTVTNFLHPITQEIKELFESQKRSRRGVQKTGRVFETEAVLVDAMGGQRQAFSRRPDTFYAPGEILLLDRNGRLIVRNDLDDETAFRHANFVGKNNMEEPEEEEDDDDDKKGKKGDGPSFGKG